MALLLLFLSGCAHFFFAIISFKLLYCFFGINSTIKIVVVVVVVGGGDGGCSFATYKLTQEHT